jgi:phage terminase small subunit
VSTRKQRPLTNKQRAFVEHYLVCWNASEAARRAGYSKKNANVVGPRLLANVGINAEIEARFAKLGMSADEVIARLTAQGRGSLSPFIRVNGEDIWVDLTSEEAQANLHLLKEIETERRRYGKDEHAVEEFKVKVKIHDPQAALVHLGRHHKLFTDKMELDDSERTDEERAARITAILDKARARRTG